MQTVKQLGQQLARKITANKNLSYLLQCWSRKGILPSSVWHRLPVNGNFSVQIEDNYFPMSLRPVIVSDEHFIGVAGKGLSQKHYPYF